MNEVSAHVTVGQSQYTLNRTRQHSSSSTNNNGHQFLFLDSLVTISTKGDTTWFLYWYVVCIYGVNVVDPNFSFSFSDPDPTLTLISDPDSNPDPTCL